MNRAMIGRWSWMVVMAIALTAVMATGAEEADRAASEPITPRQVKYPAAGGSMHSLIYEPSPGKALGAGVLVFGEWWGLDDFAKAQAAALAEQGFVVMAVDLYGEGRSTSHPRMAGTWSTGLREDLNKWLGRADAAVKVFARETKLPAERTAAIGFSFGGTTVLHMAYHGMAVEAVAGFYSSLPIPAEAQAEKIRAKLLILHGAADPFVKPTEVSALTTTLTQMPQVDWTMISYGGAEHGFVNPDAAEHRMEGVAYHAAAAKRAAQHLSQFLRETLNVSEAH